VKKRKRVCSADSHDAARSRSSHSKNTCGYFLVRFWCAFGPLFVMYHAHALVPYNTQH
jgi:hypothetical protein